MPGQNRQRRGTARTLPNFCVVLCIFCVVLYIFCVVLYIFVLFYVLFVLCRSLYCLCLYMCTELLPPGGYPIAVNKYIVYVLLSISPASICNMPTFRNHVSVPSSKAGNRPKRTYTIFKSGRKLEIYNKCIISYF